MRGLFRTLLEGSTIVSLVACQNPVTSGSDREISDTIEDSSGSHATGDRDTTRSGRGDVRDAVVGPIHFVGRFDNRDALGPRFSWPGTQIRTRFSGTGATITLDEVPYGIHTDQLDVSIDGAPPTLLRTNPGPATYWLGGNLPDGDHDLVITKRTEASVGTLQLIAIESKEGRPLVPTTRTTTRSIEFIGDSMSTGYGVLGKSPCVFTADTESEALGYGAVTASLLDAEHSTIAWSGIGLYRDLSGITEEQMPARYLRALAADPTSDWDFSHAPDVVVVNLGMNDFSGGDPGAPFRDTTTSFAALIRAKYPKAHIVLAVSAMMGEQRENVKAALHAVVSTRTTAGDSNVSFFEFEEQLASDGYGCDYHPTPTSQRKSAEKLAAHVRAITGW